jgi:aldose 1-epimerase
LTTIDLQLGRTRALVVPAAGGRLHQLEIHDGRRWLPLLHAPSDLTAALAEPLAWSSYPMLPWPNRVDSARFTWRGRLHTLKPNLEGHAIHGIGCFRPWTVEAVSANSCRLSLDFGTAWPFGGRAVQEMRLLDDGIIQRIEGHATRDAFPAGAGWHPWFRRDVRRGQSARLLVDAAQVYETVDMIPTGWLKPAVRDLDLRGGAPLGTRHIDTCYRHPRGPLRIVWGDVELTMEHSPNVTHAVVYTPRHAVCLEPQTCAIDAFNLDAQGIEGTGVEIVAPGRPLIAWTEWRWRTGVESHGTPGGGTLR